MFIRTRKRQVKIEGIRAELAKHGVPAKIIKQMTWREVRDAVAEYKRRGCSYQQ